ncbi:hypothetical protein HNY73_019358 [Argiope bruennichi]|uniref:Uncharacterized protein n=1 Tax=Argiope bruennichi TaxID=94029 RepID=A0A8T0EH20_ARGBR|nr:hypothetical protein HNY73_019358 [Argiope bruennichi]
MADIDGTLCWMVETAVADAVGRPLLGREAKEHAASNFCIILVNAEHVIGPLPSRIPFMLRYARNARLELIFKVVPHFWISHH